MSMRRSRLEIVATIISGVVCLDLVFGALRARVSHVVSGQWTPEFGIISFTGVAIGGIAALYALLKHLEQRGWWFSLMWAFLLFDAGALSYKAWTIAATRLVAVPAYVGVAVGAALSLAAVFVVARLMQRAVSRGSAEPCHDEKEASR